MTIQFDKDTLKDVHVTNVVERLIDEEFPTVMKKFPVACWCCLWLADILALGLLGITPRFVATDRGDLFERVHISDMMVKVEALRAMTEAVEKVSRNPRHALD